MRSSARVIVLAALVASSASVAQARGSLLDVPYLSQTPQLCGGAAVAMVLRYWGAEDVFPQDFASLVDRSESGIRTSALTDAVARRGWQAAAHSQEPNRAVTWLGAEIAKGRPVIALVQVTPRTYHYVVVVGVTPAEVVYHDPARAPFRIVPIREFEEQWAAANRWTLVVLPAADRTSPTTEVRLATTGDAAPAPAGTAPCAELIAHSVTLARSGQLDEAERALMTAERLCPDGALARLELGGVRFLQRRYAEAEALAASAIAADMRDETAWDLLATSRYLQGDLLGALDAWNQIDRPRTDVVRVEGVERLDHPVIVERTGLEPREPITSSAFARAERRLGEMPTIKGVSLNYFPRTDGMADVRAVLSERSVLPRGGLEWAAVGVNSAFRRELRLLVAGPLRQGETWDFRYRWRPNRPRLRIGFALPAPGVLPGVLGVEGLWERQSYEPVEQPLREVRNRVAVYLTDWVTDRVRWLAGGAADEFGGRRYLAIQGEIDRRWLNDHVSTAVSAGYWAPIGPAGNTRGFSASSARVTWRSTKNGAPEWIARGGVTAVSETTPLAIWPIAGSGESRGPLLRAHELHSDGIVVSGIFGRRLAFGSIEYQQPVYSKKGATVALAGFTDTGRAWNRPFTPEPSPFHVDVGMGLRLSTGVYDDQLRIDFAFGLRDHRRTISAGYVMPFGQ